MKHFIASPGAFAPSLAGLAAVLCTGCATHSVTKMDARYEKTRLPNHFDPDTRHDKVALALTATASEKEWHGYNYKGQGPTYTLSNAGYGVDGSLLVEKEGAHFGGSIGITPDPGLFRLAGFAGTSARYGRLISSFTLGLALNGSRVEAHVKDTRWRYDNGLFPYPVTTFDSSSGIEAAGEIPVRAGILVDLGRVSPYLAASGNLLAIGVDGGHEILMMAEGGAGLQCRVGAAQLIRLEGTASNTRTDRGAWLGPRYGARVDLASEF